MRQGADDGQLYLGAPETRLPEDPADDRVVEDREHQVLELDLDGVHGGLVGELVVEVEVLGLAALVGLGPLNGGHERVRHGRVVAGLAGRHPVEGHAEAELQGLELEARGVGGVAGAGARLPQRRRREGEEGRHGVERRRLRVAAAARDAHGLVQRVGRLGGQALPGRADRRRHRRRAGEGRGGGRPRGGNKKKIPRKKGGNLYTKKKRRRRRRGKLRSGKLYTTKKKNVERNDMGNCRYIIIEPEKSKKKNHLWLFLLLLL